MKKLLGILVLGLLCCNVGFAKGITLKDLINKGKIYEGMSKVQLSKTGGFPSFRKIYAEVFECDANLIREYYPSKKIELLAGGAESNTKHEMEGNRVYFVFKNVTVPSHDNRHKDGYNCGEAEAVGNGTLDVWFFTQEEAEDYIAGIEDKKDNKKIKKKSSIEEFKQICTDIGLTLGTSEFVDCVLKLKSDEEKMIMESQRLETEENIAKEKQKTAKDKQGLEQEKYDDEERERKQKKYEECLEETSEIYGEPKLFRCSLELL